MAGKITISTLNNDTGVLATQNGMTGIAKAWVNFNGTGTVAIRDSFNVSSITDNGTGDYTINFTTAMPNANYAAMGCFQWDQTSTTTQAAIWLQLARFAQTASAVRVATGIWNGTAYDGTTVTVAVFSS